MSNKIEAGKVERVALLGNPNAGKSSLFNGLTGLRQKVGNYSGVTIDKNIGTWIFSTGEKVELLDLPGIYSLFAKAPDERVVLPPLLDQQNPDHPDVLIVVLDASQLTRSLLLLDQIRTFNFPIVVALNMIDIAQTQGVTIDVETLQQTLQVPVVPINARAQEGLLALQAAVLELPQQTAVATSPPIAAVWQEELQQIIPIDSLLHAKLLLSQYEQLPFLSESQRQSIAQFLQKHQLDILHLQTEDAKMRLEKLEQLANKVSQKTSPKITLTERLDRLLLHPISGYLVFFFLLLLVFQSIFNLASGPMEWIDGSFADAATYLKEVLPATLLTDLMVDGVWAGIGGIVIFVPQIAILFGIIAILEETGYLSRVMFLTDKTMSRFGLNGKSIVPLVSGAACAVPAIMATRSISSWRERLITIFVTPLMSCSARLPVYIIFISLIVPATAVWGPFGLQSLVLGGLYFGGFVAALLSAWLFNKLWKPSEEEKQAVFVLELPSYKLPQWRSIGITIYQKTSEFVIEAGKIILAISIILWVMATYGPPQAMYEAEQTAVELYQKDPSLADSEEQLIASQKLEASFIGQVGHFIEPVIRPLGYDWKIGIALITSFAAREVFVSTMATIYSVGDEEEGPLLEKLRQEKHPETGAPLFSVAVSVSLLVFYLFAMQCMATLAIVQRETHSWKWPILQFVYMTALAYIGAWLAYQLLS
ncbi:MAG: ferrous iron transport protein B [Aureispira sp.]